MSRWLKPCPIWKRFWHHQPRHLQHCKRKISTDVIHIHPQVEDAVHCGKPVVAFESTIITHGMPYPQNLETAQAVEKIARDGGVVPATVGILDGKIHVGLSPDQLEKLATAKDATKTSRRDLAWVISQKLMGGTTVSATMFIASKAGIPIFITGGIGGVHRGGETSFDISCDLTELGRTPVCVISAGIKSILDIPKTLEYLESEGVTVATFGESREFPAFFSPTSGIEANMNVRTAKEAASLIAANHYLGLGSGILIAVPIPEEHAGDGDFIERSIQQAVIEAEDQQIQGKDVTPFILQRVNKLTSGKTLEANIALMKNNTMVGCEIAKEYSNLPTNVKTQHRNIINQLEAFLDHTKNYPGRRSYSTFSRIGSNREIRNLFLGIQSNHRKRIQWLPSHCYHGNTSQKSSLVVIGASIVDFVVKAKSEEIMLGGVTNRGSVNICFGGVARNVADCLTRLGERPLFVSALGKDQQAKSLLEYNPQMRQDGLMHIEDYPTATYLATLKGNGELMLGISDMDIAGQLTPEHISCFEEDISQAPLVVVDGNSLEETINFICQLCAKHSIPVWFEPTCLRKCRKPFLSDSWRTLTYASPNLNELRNMYAAIEGDETVDFDRDISLTDKLREVIQLSRRLLQSMYCLVVTLGEDGVMVLRNAEPEEKFVSGKLLDQDLDGMISAVYYPPYFDGDRQDVVSVSGAGDCFAAAMIAGIVNQKDPDLCIKMGLYAAQKSLRCHQAVPEIIYAEDFDEDTIKEQVTSEPSRML